MFWKGLYFEQSSADTKNREKLPSMQRVNTWYNINLLEREDTIFREYLERAERIQEGMLESFVGPVSVYTPVSVYVDTNGCSRNRYCTLSTISGARVDNTCMCIINAYCPQCPILFLDIRNPLIDLLSKYRKNWIFKLLDSTSYVYIDIVFPSLGQYISQDNHIEYNHKSSDESLISPPISHLKLAALEYQE